MSEICSNFSLYLHFHIKTDCTIMHCFVLFVISLNMQRNTRFISVGGAGQVKSFPLEFQQFVTALPESPKLAG